MPAQQCFKTDNFTVHVHNRLINRPEFVTFKGITQRFIQRDLPPQAFFKFMIVDSDSLRVLAFLRVHGDIGELDQTGDRGIVFRAHRDTDGSA